MTGSHPSLGTGTIRASLQSLNTQLSFQTACIQQVTSQIRQDHLTGPTLEESHPPSLSSA